VSFGAEHDSRHTAAETRRAAEAAPRAPEAVPRGAEATPRYAAEAGFRAVMVSVAAPDRETARRLARLLVEGRQAACVQVIDPILSVYRWKGEVKEEAEVLLLAKSSQDLLPRIGELVAVRATFSHRLRDDADIRVSGPLEGGSLMDVGCYCVSGARLVAGEEPAAVYGEQVTTEDGVDRRFTGLLRFPSGLTATFHCGFDAFTESLEIIGREGTLSLPDPWHSLQGLLLLDGEEVRVESRNPYQCEIEDMAAAIRGEKAPRLGRADALGQARAIEALYRSAESGRPVSLG